MRGAKAVLQLPAVAEVVVQRRVGAIPGNDLHAAACGRILIQSVTQLEIASTELRQLILTGRDLRYLVPETVRDIILRTGCYAPGGR